MKRGSSKKSAVGHPRYLVNVAEILDEIEDQEPDHFPGSQDMFEWDKPDFIEEEESEDEISNEDLVSKSDTSEPEILLANDDEDDEEPKRKKLDSTKANIPGTGRQRDPIWTSFDTVYAADKTISSNVCKVCKASVSAKAVRMKQHLSKCKPKSASAPVPFHHAPESDNSQPSDSQTSVSSTATSTCASTSRSEPVFLKQSRMDKFVKGINMKSKDQIDTALGRFIFSSNISFHVLENPELKDFVALLNPAYTLPSHDKIGSTVLNKVYEEVQQKMKMDLKGTHGILLQDGWTTNQNDAVIAHCVKSGENIHLLSTSTPGTEKSDAEYCYQEAQKAIKKAAELECKIVGLVVDNCTTMISLQNKVKANLIDVEAYGCNSHLMNLLGKHFTPPDVQDNVNKIQVYMKNHKYTVASLKKMNARLPVLPGTTRWNSQMDSFQNYLQNQPIYLKIVRQIKPDGKREREKLEEILGILNDTAGKESFYSRVEETVKILQPIGIALDKLQRNDANLADAIFCWVSLIHELPDDAINTDYFQKQKKLGMTPVAAAAYILHPHYKGENLPEEEKNSGLNWIAGKSEFYLMLVGEIQKSSSDYFYDAFLSPTAKKTIKPIDWWTNATTSAIPAGFVDLMKILFLYPASTAGVERCFSTMGNIMTKQRNRLSVEKATKLCTINNFYRIQHSQKERQEENQKASRKRTFIE